MSTPASEVKSWSQPNLFGAEPVELVLRIGLIPGSDHAQFQLETFVGHARVLTGMRSRPHVPWSEVWTEMREWTELLTAAVEEVDTPF